LEIGITPKEKGSILQKSSLLKHYVTTSDEFFEKYADILNKGVDVAFIDGLHTYEQTVKDVDNTLKYLNEGGLIVMHDCNPPTLSASYPASSYEEAAKLNLPGWTGEWNGDVWKTIVLLRSLRKDLHVFVLDCDYGVGVVCKGKPEDILSYTVEEINKMSFKDLSKDRRKLLNLKEPAFLFKFLETLKPIN